MNDFDLLINDLEKVAKDLNSPKTKVFLKKQANEYKKTVKNLASTRVKKKTGNYLKGIKTGKSYEYNNAKCIRVFNSAPHGHLIEYGHKNVKNGKVHGFTRGKHVFEDSKKEFEKEFEKNVAEFQDEILKKNGF